MCVDHDTTKIKEIPMKGNEKIIAILNDFLEDELTAINQYIVHSEMCANWGYNKLHGVAEKRAIDEMKHAEKLIARILFLEGLPVVGNLKKMNIGATVEAQLKNDWEAEAGAIKAYNDGIRLCLELADNGTRDLIDSNLVDEEAHLDWLESQLDQVKQMGLQNYLLGQTG
jgi:bacterioferritin